MVSIATSPITGVASLIVIRSTSVNLEAVFFRTLSIDFLIPNKFCLVPLMPVVAAIPEPTNDTSFWSDTSASETSVDELPMSTPSIRFIKNHSLLSDIYHLLHIMTLIVTF